MKEQNALGVASLILGIFAIFLSIVFFISIPLAIAALITGIIALIKKKKKTLPVTGIILAIVSIVLSIVIIFLVGVIAKRINNSESKDLAKSSIVRLYNGVAEGITDDVHVDNKIDGYSWKGKDNSVLELKSDGTYYWYKDGNDKTDNYYTGTYTSCLGDKAIEKIDKEYGFNETSSVINGEKMSTVQTTPYALFFYNAGSNVCESFNLKTQNSGEFTKVK